MAALPAADSAANTPDMYDHCPLPALQVLKVYDVIPRGDQRKLQQWLQRLQAALATYSPGCLAFCSQQQRSEKGLVLPAACSQEEVQGWRAAAQVGCSKAPSVCRAERCRGCWFFGASEGPANVTNTPVTHLHTASLL